MAGKLDPYDPRGTWLAFEADSKAEGLDEKHARKMYLRWFVSQELALSIAPGLGSSDAQASAGASRLLKSWLKHDRERLVSHLTGAMSACARMAGIERFTREQVAEEVELVAHYNLNKDVVS